MPDGENSSWYSYAKKDSPLEQGDVLFGCTISILTKESGVINLAELTANFAVLNQSCDLIAQPGKLKARAEHVLLAEAQELELKESALAEIHAGRKPGLYVLPRKSRKSHPKNHLIVNFHRIYSVHSEFLPNIELIKRIRLRSPYREHIMQAFALTYTRIALDEIPSLK
jgi:hypothetical protein